MVEIWCEELSETKATVLCDLQQTHDASGWDTQVVTRGGAIRSNEGWIELE